MSKKLTVLCKVLGNPERVRLVKCLAREMSVSELLEKCDLSQSALSQHLALLRSANVLKTRRDGRHIYYQTASPEYLRLAKLIINLTNVT
ncbi:MAG: ArsR/SmtB family transcription factor [Minisyncoccota bacterium]